MASRKKKPVKWAKKKKKKKQKKKCVQQPPQTFQDCSGSGCTISQRVKRVRQLVNFEGFDYSTPSVFEHRTKTERKKLGCTFKKVKYVGKDGKTKTKEIVADRREMCQEAAKPCSGDRVTKGTSCPVQLFYKRGQATLRFCNERNKPGKVIAVNSPQEAQKIASKACAYWAKKGTFKGYKPFKSAGLGKRKRRR